MPKTTPKFFCEFCGTEVNQKDKFCPRCGKFFAAVRCPACGLTGQAPLFVKGCPSCGYAVFPGAGNDSGGKRVHGGGAFHGLLRLLRRKPGKEGGGDPLPLWVYAVIVAFAGILVGVILSFPV